MEHNNNRSGRLLSLDVFRGITIAMMIVVNSPGTSGQLSHAYWDGVTIADLVFPFFIFIVGLSVGINRGKFEVVGDERTRQVKSILGRTLSLFLLGLVVNAFYTNFESIRLLGVLQRIAIVYCGCAFALMYLTSRQVVVISCAILLVYWVLILGVPFPGGAAGSLEWGHNLVNWFDQQFLPGMLWRGSWDPEGILSTFPALVTGASGMLLGMRIRAAQSLEAAMLQLLVWGFLMFVAGYLWSFYFPLIKQLWTSSFVLLTSGLAAMFFGVLIYLVEGRPEQSAVKFFKVFGLNATVVYVFHVILHYLLDKDIQGESLHEAFMHGFSPLVGGTFSSTLFILLFLLACFGLNGFLYRKRVFVRL